MESDAIFDRIFKMLYGKPCWNVKPGYGSFLTLEFGKPHLQIHEPRKPRPDASLTVGSLLSRRHIRIHGDWHLWIYCCEWSVSLAWRIVGDSSSTLRIKRAANVLDGQKLISAVIIPRGSRSVFEFDLGGLLETNPYDRKSEQWMLFEPSGYVLTYRADKRYSHSRSSTTPDEINWKRAFEV